MELNINVVVLRATDADLCANQGFREALEERVLSNYRVPSQVDDKNCQLEGLNQISCSEKGIKQCQSLTLIINSC